MELQDGQMAEMEVVFPPGLEGESSIKGRAFVTSSWCSCPHLGFCGGMIHIIDIAAHAGGEAIEFIELSAAETENPKGWFDLPTCHHTWG